MQSQASGYLRTVRAFCKPPILLGVAYVIAAFSGASSAQDAPSGTASAWVKLCETTKVLGNDKQIGPMICMIHYERLELNTGIVLVAAAVRQVEDQIRQAFMVVVPLGILVPPGIQVLLYSEDAWRKAQLNEKVEETKLKYFSLSYTHCHPGGCAAETEATADLLADLNTNAGLAVLAVDATGQTLSFQVPLDGFAKAYAGRPIDNVQYSEARKRLFQEISDRQHALMAQPQKNNEIKGKEQ